MRSELPRAFHVPGKRALPFYIIRYVPKLGKYISAVSGFDCILRRAKIVSPMYSDLYKVYVEYPSVTKVSASVGLIDAPADICHMATYSVLTV